MGKLSIWFGGSKRARAAKVVLVVALVALLVVSVYEVDNYGHEVKWKAVMSTGANDNQLGSFDWVQANNNTVLAHYTTSNGYILSGLYAFTPEGKVRWSYRNEGSYGINSPVLTSNGTVYFGGTLVNASAPSLIALTPDGDVAWSYPVTNGSFWPIAIGPEGNVYANHQLYDGNNYPGYEFMAFSPGGSLLWKQWFQYAPGFSVCTNGTILLSSYRNLTAFSPSGSVLWESPDHRLYFDAINVNDALYFTWNAALNVSGRIGISADLVATDLNGTILWQYPDYIAETNNGGDLSCLSPIVLDRNGDLLFVRYNGTSTEKYTSLFAVSPEGKLRWEYRDSYIGVPSARDDRIVVGTSSGLTALDLNGRVLWKVNVQNINGAPVIGADGTVYVGTQSGLIAIGTNPIVLEAGPMVLAPIIAICLLVLWRTHSVRTR